MPPGLDELALTTAASSSYEDLERYCKARFRSVVSVKALDITLEFHKSSIRDRQKSKQMLPW